MMSTAFCREPFVAADFGCRTTDNPPRRSSPSRTMPGGSHNVLTLLVGEPVDVGLGDGEALGEGDALADGFGDVDALAEGDGLVAAFAASCSRLHNLRSSETSFWCPNTPPPHTPAITIRMMT